MYTIKINHKKVGVKEYTIYTREEAEEAGIEYVYWKDCKEEGVYCLTDDNYVAYLIKRKVYGLKTDKRRNIYMRFPFGYVMYKEGNEKIKLNVEGRKSRYTMSGKKYMEVQAGQDRLKNLATTYAMTGSKDAAIDLAFPDGVSKSTRGRYRRMMKTEVFRKMVKEELQRLLMDSGLTESYTMDLLRDTIDMAVAKNDVTNLLKAVRNLEELHGMLDRNVTKTTESIEMNEKHRLIDQIGEESRKFKARRSIEYEAD